MCVETDSLRNHAGLTQNNSLHFNSLIRLQPCYFQNNKLISPPVLPTSLGEFNFFSEASKPGGALSALYGRQLAPQIRHDRMEQGALDDGEGEVLVVLVVQA